MITPLLFALALQAAPDPVLTCVSDPATGDVRVMLLFPAPDGEGRRTLDSAGQQSPVVLEDRPEAAGLDWYEAGTPIVRDGVTYRPNPHTFSTGGAVNRYLRHVGLHEGAPLFSIWPGGDIDLAVLVHQENCVFRVYGRDERR
ncbi:MAG: hypothetical protein EON87_05010 [Brevundimonas sp.]|nr:MAG: hypothetical protein EON87_05010 [Brevundimonas sp.]